MTRQKDSLRIFNRLRTTSLPPKMAASALKIALKISNPSRDAAAVPCRYSAGTTRISALSNTTKTHPLSFSPSSTNYEPTRFRPVRAFGSNRVSDPAFDVVIVGAGIIGLTIARQFLLGSNLSVAVVDAAVPCTGATGAGQGYIWRVHKIPGSDKWELAMRSHQLWEEMAESITNQGMDPLLELGWKKTGPDIGFILCLSINCLIKVLISD